MNIPSCLSIGCSVLLIVSQSATCLSHQVALLAAGPGNPPHLAMHVDATNQPGRWDRQKAALQHAAHSRGGH